MGCHTLPSLYIGENIGATEAIDGLFGVAYHQQGTLLPRLGHSPLDNIRLVYCLWGRRLISRRLLGRHLVGRHLVSRHLISIEPMKDAVLLGIGILKLIYHSHPIEVTDALAEARPQRGAQRPIQIF